MTEQENSTEPQPQQTFIEIAGKIAQGDPSEFCCNYNLAREVLQRVTIILGVRSQLPVPLLTLKTIDKEISFYHRIKSKPESEKTLAQMNVLNIKIALKLASSVINWQTVYMCATPNEFFIEYTTHLVQFSSYLDIGKATLDFLQDSSPELVLAIAPADYTGLYHRAKTVLQKAISLISQGNSSEQEEKMISLREALSGSIPQPTLETMLNALHSIYSISLRRITFPKHNGSELRVFIPSSTFRVAVIYAAHTVFPKLGDPETTDQTTTVPDKEIQQSFLLLTFATAFEIISRFTSIQSSERDDFSGLIENPYELRKLLEVIRWTARFVTYLDYFPEMYSAISALYKTSESFPTFQELLLEADRIILDILTRMECYTHLGEVFFSSEY